ncbi:asparagine synthase (glutamine-hydrolysing) [Halogranum amylolyticum]|uniref:Asparagine synthase (Glutamine-hydrolysing) n=1 Tax=Halogranum amylolyticum TaxID=660520 RepID=A0A1H8PC38_9EURY|nr:asparagine synthase-related protein [Halogranum amylolyticum]SEO39396.1 asparagine synthase (glutamine-hydrolysing) [Halogranum amylolyticum]
MTGICGAVGDVPSLDVLAEDLAYNGDERVDTFCTDDVGLASVSHPETRIRRPETDGDVVVRVWGSIWGDDTDDGYVTVEEDAETYCARRYREAGIGFLEGLNGNFAGALYDAEAGTLSLFTDRMGTRPIHYYRGDSAESDAADVATPEDSPFVFSTSIQSLPLHPDVSTDFDEDYLTEYFALKRPFGLKTPLTGVEKLHPGSVLTVDVDEGTTTTERYWTPHYDPVDAPREQFVERLAETIKRVVADRTRDDATHGLLLSGGSDSRLVLAAFDALDEPVRTYHLNEWENREARVAERAADVVGAEHTLLERDEGYQSRSLDTAPRFSNFVGYFNQHHAGGFAETFRAECDYLFTGHYGDMLFKGNHLRTPSVDLGPLGSFDLPTGRPIRGLDDFVSERVAPKPTYLTTARSPEDVYYDNVVQRGRTVVDHGVEYLSLREATVCSRYPITNGTSQFFYYATAQMLPAGTPFLDNRLVDLFLKIPPKQLLRGDLINRATDRLSPELASIPHGSGLVPISYPFAAQWTSELARGLVSRFRPHESTQRSDGPWSDHHGLIREHSFVREVIDDNEERIKSLPFLSWEGVKRCYDEHAAGENRMKELYSLVTFLQMPLLDRLGHDVDDRERTSQSGSFVSGDSIPGASSVSRLAND